MLEAAVGDGETDTRLIAMYYRIMELHPSDGGTARQEFIEVRFVSVVP